MHAWRGRRSQRSLRAAPSDEACGGARERRASRGEERCSGRERRSSGCAADSAAADGAAAAADAPPRWPVTGSLVKRGSAWPHKWQERYFVLARDGSLAYFESWGAWKAGQPPRGKLNAVKGVRAGATSCCSS